MLEVADVMRRDGDAYLRKFGKVMLPSHLRALRDIRDCRTIALGGHVYDCDRCGHRLYAYHSCKNRSCPKCQGDDTERWVEKRRGELLDVPYFHLVFTLPKELRPIVRQHQKTLYGVLMKASAQALIKLSADPRYVGGKVGIMAVLHTWTATMDYHPHAHLLVPGGGVTQDGRWVAARKDFLVPIHALSRIFRGLFMDLAKRALPDQHFPDAVWSKPWVVYCKPTVQGTEKVLQYLARYVHRVAFTNSRLVHVGDGQVKYRYLDRDRRQWKTMTLASEEFLRRFLQHVLPRGTHKVRYYGIWNPAHRKLLRRLQLLIGGAADLEVPAEQSETCGESDDETSPQPKPCPRCRQGDMILVKTIDRHSRGPP
jgi:predicted Zn-ribbon and HTH transcriptional regulator